MFENTTIVSSKFQSTLPRRERRCFIFHFGKNGGISIHAPAKGATALLGGRMEDLDISIHAPAKGATFR